jgi:oxygen-independent coproporphyrinogen-3 oxidase
VDDVAAAVAAVRASGVRSWGLDLISGLPLLRRDTWASTLRAALQAAPHHVSVYDLQVETGTAFGRWYTPGAAPLPPEAVTADMLRDAHEQLTAAGCVRWGTGGRGCRADGGATSFTAQV